MLDPLETTNFSRYLEQPEKNNIMAIGLLVAEQKASALDSDSMLD